MEKVYYTTDKKLRSYNNRSNKTVFETELKNDFNSNFAHLYSEIPFHTNNLKTVICYLIRERKLPAGESLPDIDNISKPIIDAFRGIIYDDDDLVVQRLASKINLDTFDVTTIDATDMPLEVFSKLHGFCSDHSKLYVTLLGVSEIDVNSIKVGEI